MSEKPPLTNPARLPSSDLAVGDAQRRARRVRLVRRVELLVGELGELTTGHTLNVSRAGMFIHTYDPQPVGSLVLFKIGVADKRKVIQGSAEVVWVRIQDEGAGRPAGMGLRFNTLNDDGNRLLAETLDSDGEPASG
jgi:uncharacterized protein (TIGR02266 family)